ncbi:ABC-type multidrug transport system ATPase subunit [Larkinella arboricola]|uniref:ABC-type multidrug transport system ATPase subunit n=1 Tax=Larkinella arboricola TaxID=643671 RepID=A0A327X8P6_LARAB|nr:ABC transporter ATP-binding protein [Larkinella arboricola]RAK03069.1 ABC-type multidrug transport system ATPase subunit [Larkinella arboricola]
MDAIIIENVSKSYGEALAVADVSLSIRVGELFGLIGPDGAGKTTLFKILVTLLLPDAGRATVVGRDVVRDYKDLRQRVGYMPGRFSLYPDLSVQENLAFFATVFGTTIRQNYHLIQEIYSQLEPFKNRRAGQLSGGMKQKLALCCALIHKPEVLFLDEPTTGVDAVSRKEFWDMLRKLNERGLTTLVSTPYMDEADRCDRIAFMQTGRVLAVDQPSVITNRFRKPLFAVRAADTYRLIQDLRQAPFTESCYSFGEFLHLTVRSGGVTDLQIGQYLLDKNHRNIEIQPIQPGIEDTFMALMNQPEPTA